MKLYVNEQMVEVKEGTTLFSLREQMKPEADITIVNGAALNEDTTLEEGDGVVFIRRGEVPSGAELEALMAARHTPGVHARLKAATVGIAGLGGLGSSIAVALARIGVGRLILADFDVVEPSNLNRQFYFTDQMGLPKTEALVQTLRRVNPYVRVTAQAVKLSSDNLFPLFDGVDVMIEAFDRPDQKAMLLQAFTSRRPQTPFIGASGMAGVGGGERIGIRRMGRFIYIVGDLQTAAQPGCGLMAPRVGIAAHMQADLATALLCGVA